MWPGILLLATAARADVVACNGVEIVSTAPEAGAADVPLDARLTFGFGGCGDPSDVPVALVRIGGDGSETVVLSETVRAEQGFVASAAVDGGLEPDTGYLIRIENPSGPVEAAFVTGTSSSQPLDGEITTRSPRAWWSGRDGTVSVRAEVLPVDDPYGLSVIEVLGEDDALLSSTLARETPVSVSATWSADERPDEVCVRIVQRDGAGRQVGDEAEACAEPIRSSDCSTAGAPPAWLALLSLLLLRRSR